MKHRESTTLSHLLPSRTLSARNLFLAIALSLSLSAHATDFTWTGASDTDWTNAANWDATSGLPPVNAAGAIYGPDNVIIIQNGTHLPTANVPPWSSDQTDGTPRFVIEAGASLSINQDVGGRSGPVGGGNIVTVGTGASLTWDSDDLEKDTTNLMRDAGNLQTIDITGGIFTVATNQLKMGMKTNALTTTTLNGGTFAFTGTLFEGNQKADRSDFTDSSQVILDDGSFFSSLGAGLNGMWGTNSVPTVVFDLRDLASRVTAKFGGDFTTLAEVEAAFGVVFTSSTLGGVQVADNEDGTYTVTAVPAVEGDPPPLTITQVGGEVVISWPQSATAWRLYESPTLGAAPSPWIEIAPPYATEGDDFIYSVSAPVNADFFQLRRP